MHEGFQWDTRSWKAPTLQLEEYLSPQSQPKPSQSSYGGSVTVLWTQLTLELIPAARTLQIDLSLNPGVNLGGGLFIKEFSGNPYDVELVYGLNRYFGVGTLVGNLEKGSPTIEGTVMYLGWSDSAPAGVVFPLTPIRKLKY